MPAGQVGGGTGGPLDWFNELPKLTRSYAALLLFSAACISYGVSGIQYAVLDWNAIIRRFQVWRLFTHAAVAGKLGMTLIFDLIAVLTYGATLERSVYNIHPEDFLFMFIFGAGAMAVLGGIMGPLLGLAYIHISGKAIIMMMLYVWSRSFPEQAVSLYGVVRIKGFWLPFIWLGLSAVLGHSIFNEFCGIFIGHLWYFFTILIPQGTGETWLPTPALVRWLAAQLGMQGVAPPRAVAAPGASLFRTFRSGGHRLGGGS